MAQIDRPLTLRSFQRLVRSALGLRVSRPWLGYADVLFLELGTLHPEVSTLPKFGTRRTRVGQAGVLFHSDWRAESARCFLFGSRSRKSRLNAGLKDLKGRRVTAIFTEGLLPELVVELDRRIRIAGLLREARARLGHPARRPWTLPAGEELDSRRPQGLRRLRRRARPVPGVVLPAEDLPGHALTRFSLLTRPDLFQSST